jgi:hypothetical protein
MSLYTHEPDSDSYRVDITFDTEGDFWVASLMVQSGKRAHWTQHMRGMGDTPMAAVIALGTVAQRETDNRAAMLAKLGVA